MGFRSEPRLFLPAYPSPARSERPRREVLLNGGRQRLLWDFALKGMVVFRPDREARFIRNSSRS